jgi:DNA mismatch repair protein MutS
MTGRLPPSPASGSSSSRPARPGAADAGLSVLFSGPVALLRDNQSEPDYFPDLNLDQMISAVIAGRDEYNLRPFFYLRLTSAQEVRYRQGVLCDLERRDLREIVLSFARKMREMRASLAQARKVHYQLQRERLFLSAADTYCGAVESLARELSEAGPSSAGMRAFSGYLLDYVASAAHAEMQQEVRKLEDWLAQIKYTLHIKGSRIRVSAYDEEADYSNDVRATFQKFEHAEVAGQRSKFPALLEVDHVEAGILERVARLFPQTFEALSAFFNERKGYLDPVVGRFDRQVQFYLAYLDYISPLRASGLSFCYPDVSAQSKLTSATDTFDLVLATKLVSEKQPVICNDIRLSSDERLLVVTGPNQGGKTTYARAFGQLHYLASLGCLVPGTSATLYLPDQIFTHFEREEDIETLSGKLQDDLIRLRQVLEQATSASVIILNEIFTSTTLDDALALSTRLLEQVAALDCLSVCVTFLDELASFNPDTVSMVASIVPGNPAARTFKIVRRPADGFAYAEAVAEKYGLSYRQAKARVIA